MVGPLMVGPLMVGPPSAPCPRGGGPGPPWPTRPSPGRHAARTQRPKHHPTHHSAPAPNPALHPTPNPDPSPNPDPTRARTQCDLEPSLGRPQEPFGDKGGHHEDGQPARDPAVRQGVGAPAHGQQREAEHGYPVDGPPDPIGPGPEVARHGIGNRGSGLEQPAHTRRGGRGRHDRGQSDDHAGHVEEQHEVECGPLRLVVHAGHLRPCPRQPGDRRVMVQPKRVAEPVPWTGTRSAKRRLPMTVDREGEGGKEQ